MKRIASIAIILCIAGSTLLAIPQRANASGVVFDPINYIENAISAGVSAVSSQSTTALEVKEYVLDPIAWALSQYMLKSISSSIISFVNGQTNGVGGAQFVQNLTQYLVNVGDNQALAFLSQYLGNASCASSPYTSSITSSLRLNYLQQTSVAGFFAANQCTLSQYSADQNAFINGDWSQGGVPAWLALTTQNGNNPYLRYYQANTEMNTLVNTAQTTQEQQLAWGQGFQSWCGNSTYSLNSSVAPVQCLNADGTSGTIQTPGAVIVASLNHSLGTGMDKLVSADEIDEIVGQLVANLVTNALGGQGGLAGLSQPSSNGTSYISQMQNESAVGSNAATNAQSVAQTALTNVAQYNAVWTNIISAAKTASNSMTALAKACPAEKTTANNTITEQINPVIAQAQADIDSTASTTALANKVQSEAQSTDQSTLSTLSNDVQKLSTASPTAADVATAQANEQNTLDQMNAIVQNAATLQDTCPPSSQNQSTTTTSG